MVEFHTMVKAHIVTVLAGSLRTGSLNRAAAKVASEYLDDQATVNMPDLAPVPLFNEDLEQSGIPTAVIHLKEAVLSSDAVLIFTPEYNLGIPAVTKNAIDWLSRPYGDGSLTDRVIGIASVGPSSRGGENVRERLMHICAALGGQVYPESLGVPGIVELENDRLPAEAQGSICGWVDEVLRYSASRHSAADTNTS